MNILVISDIHGSETAARFALDLFKRHTPDLVVMLGDILYHGPRNPYPDGYAPKAVAGLFEEIASHTVAVKGNCDSEVDEMVLPFPLAPAFSWVVTPDVTIFATHGHTYGPSSPPSLPQGSVLLYGHTHVPEARLAENGVYHCNPGSLSLPKEGWPKSYGFFSGSKFTVFDTQGNVVLEQTFAR